jgi:hypothetical protein
MTPGKKVQFNRLLGENCCFPFQSRKVSHAAKFRVKYTKKEKWPGPESKPMGGCDQQEARQNQPGKRPRKKCVQEEIKKKYIFSE